MNDPLGIWIAVILLACVFARGAWHKLSDLEMFRATFEAYELAPARFARVTAPVLGVAEAIIAAGLLVPATRLPAATAAVVLLVIYGTAIAINLLRGRFDIDCGCGGRGEGLSWLLVARNVVLMLTGLIAALPTAAREFDWRDLAVLPLAVLCLWLLVVAAEQAGANNAARRQLINVFQRGT